MRRSLFVAVVAALVVLVYSATACAQRAPFPGAVELTPGQFVPCSHPLAIAAGRGCTAPTPGPSSTADAPPICTPRPDPYVEPERAAACAAWGHTHPTEGPRLALPTFTAGGTIRDAYGQRAAILAVVRSVDGAPVVVAQLVTPKPGAVFAFRADVLDAQRWEPVP